MIVVSSVIHCAVIASIVIKLSTLKIHFLIDRLEYISSLFLYLNIKIKGMIDMLKSESLLVHGEYVKIREGMFHTYVELPNGEEIQLDVDYDDLLKLLDK